jgi:hypothetical protein
MEVNVYCCLKENAPGNLSIPDNLFAQPSFSGTYSERQSPRKASLATFQMSYLE